MILITGASRGIGAEIARRFARDGGRCILIGRNEDALKSVRAEIIESARRGEGIGSGRADGEEHGHRIIVGDVGNVEFWNEIKKEVGLII